jgi:hypothetical protein
MDGAQSPFQRAQSFKPNHEIRALLPSTVTLGAQHDTTKTAKKVTASNNRSFSELLADLSFFPNSAALSSTPLRLPLARCSQKMPFRESALFAPRSADMARPHF